MIAYFGLEGALPALREVQFQVLPRYAAMAVEARPLPLGQWIAVRSEICLGAATLVATAVALVVARWRRDLARTAPLFTGAAAAYAATAIQMRFQRCFEDSGAHHRYVCRHRTAIGKRASGENFPLHHCAEADTARRWR